MSIVNLILGGLIHNEDYGRKVLPFINHEYFDSPNYKLLFNVISEHVAKYNSFPTKEILHIELNEKENIPDDIFKSTQTLISSLESSDAKLEWLVDKTEEFCKERALYNAISKSVAIYKDSEKPKGEISKLLETALAVSFDTNIGHDFIDDSNKRYEYYHTTVSRIPFDLFYFNKITNNGLPAKTLTVFLAGVNIGKTQLMAHCAANNLRSGYNVLYITLEMAEEEIAKRIDANLLNVEMDNLDKLSKKDYDRKIENLKTTCKGKLLIKEYPTSQAHTGHFRHLVNELKIKKKFAPDIIYIDYINICASSRIKRGQANSYEYIKAIAEELRGLAVEMEVPVVTATQLNRTGFKSSDIDITDTAESFGLPATADLMIGLISTDELEEAGQILCKQLKNRLGNKQNNKMFVIGVDRSKMRFFDVEDTAQEDIIDGPAFDNSKFGDEENERTKSRFQFK